jgi:hypothetical protein
MKKKKINIQDIDFKCFDWLWRWKLLSTSALHKGIYSGRSANRCYRRLIELEKSDYIISIRSWDDKNSVWHLGDAGYEVLQQRFKDQFPQGFRSENKDHDFWVTAIHLGEWITGVPENCDYFTEQQLRKLSTEEFPKWVPHSKQHRPDGYWKIGSSQSDRHKLIALEVEFSKKSAMAYSWLGDFYSNIIIIDQVIWVVKTNADIKYILSHLKKGSSSQAREQSFVLLDQFIKFGWQAEIFVGKDQGKRLSEILNDTKNPEASQWTYKGLLDLRKKAIDSTTLKLPCEVDLGLSRKY